MEEVNKPLKDWELSRLAQGMSPPEFEQIAVGYLGLPKVRLAQCERNSGNNCVAYMTNSLLSWRDSTPHDEARQVLYKQLSKAADHGLVGKTCIQFLNTREEDEIQECAEVPKWSLIGCWRKCDEWLKLHWQKFLRWISIFELLVTLPFAILNGSDSWLKLDQLSSTLTRNLVKIDNLYFFPLFPVLSVIYFAGLGIKKVVIIKYHWRGTSGREQLVNRRKIRLRYTLIVAFVLSSLFYAIYIMYTTISIIFAHISVSTLEQPMMFSLDSYSAYPEVEKSWDQLQVGNKCCGVHNYTDWFRLPLHGHFSDSFKMESPNGVPDSCCKQLTVGCGRNVTNPENIYRTGCLNNLRDHIENQIGKSIGKIQRGSLVVLLIILVCAHIVHRFIRKDGCKDKRQLYNRNNDIENTTLIENNVSNDIEINIEDEGADREVLINIRDDEESENNGNQIGSVNMGTTVIHIADVHRDACAYSDDHSL